MQLSERMDSSTIERVTETNHALGNLMDMAAKQLQEIRAKAAAEVAEKEAAAQREADKSTREEEKRKRQQKREASFWARFFCFGSTSAK